MDNTKYLTYKLRNILFMLMWWSQFQWL